MRRFMVLTTGNVYSYTDVIYLSSCFVTMNSKTLTMYTLKVKIKSKLTLTRKSDWLGCVHVYCQHKSPIWLLFVTLIESRQSKISSAISYLVSGRRVCAYLVVARSDHTATTPYRANKGSISLSCAYGWKVIYIYRLIRKSVGHENKIPTKANGCLVSCN